MSVCCDICVSGHSSTPSSVSAVPWTHEQTYKQTWGRLIAWHTSFWVAEWIFSYWTPSVNMTITFLFAVPAENNGRQDSLQVGKLRRQKGPLLWSVPPQPLWAGCPRGSEGPQLDVSPMHGCLQLLNLQVNEMCKCWVIYSFCVILFKGNNRVVQSNFYTLSGSKKCHTCAGTAWGKVQLVL